VLAALSIGADPNDPGQPLGAVEGAWQSLMHAIDPGTLAGDQGWGLRLLMLAVTIGGIFITHLRNIAEGARKRLNVVSEMMDMRNRALAQVARADDFIVSDKLVSLMLSQLSENKNLDRVFRQLFSADGSEIYIRPMSGYVKPGVAVDFYTVLESAARRNETAIGYRLMAHADDRERGYGVRVNPKKSEKVAYEAADQIIVLAED
jgi:hypothetical protein